MRPAVSRVALYGYLGSGNIGNDASFETVLYWLRSTHPEVAVSCITIAPEEATARYGLPSALLASRTSPGERRRVVEFAAKVRGRLRDLRRSYLLAGAADAIIVPGMGVLEETLGTQPWGLPYWLFLSAAACRVRRRRFVLLDVGADPALNPVTRWLYVATTRLATHVSYRDHQSAAVMTNVGAREPDAVAPDLAFAHPASRSVEPELGRVVVGLMAYYGRGDDPVRGKDVRRRYITTMADTLAELVGSGYRVVLVGGDEVDVDVSWEVLSAVRKGHPGLPEGAIVVRDVATFTELTNEMRRAEVVIASRFHNLICALRLGRPTIAIGYAAKSRDLMHAVGVDGYFQRIEELDGCSLVAQVRAAARDAEGLVRQITQGSRNYAADVESLLELVAYEALGLAASRPERNAQSAYEESR